MNNFLKMMAVAVALPLMSACSNSNAATETKADDSAKTDSNVLVAYFSATGNTAKAAKEVADVTGGTLYEITPEQPYTDEDLDYENKDSRTTAEKDDPAMRPAIKTGLDVAPYETVYLGFPIWWYKAPNIIYTFLDTYDFSGKKIVVFATSGSSTLESSYDALVKAYPQYTFEKGEVLNAATKSSFESWLESLNK